MENNKQADNVIPNKFNRRFPIFSIINIVYVSIVLVISLILVIAIMIFTSGISDSEYGNLNENIETLIAIDEDTDNGLQQQYNISKNLGITQADYEDWSVAVYTIMLVAFQFIFIFRAILLFLVLVLSSIVLASYKFPFRLKLCFRLLIVNIIFAVLLLDIIVLAFNIIMAILIKKERALYYLVEESENE